MNKLLIVEDGRTMIYLPNGEFLDAGFIQEIPGSSSLQKRIVELSCTLVKFNSFEDTGIEFTLFCAKNDSKKLGYFFSSKNTKTEKILREIFKNSKTIEQKGNLYCTIFNFITETNKE